MPKVPAIIVSNSWDMKELLNNMKVRSLKELKDKQTILLDSPKSNYVEYGKAFGEIYELARTWASNYILGDEYLIDEVSRFYVKQQQHLYNIQEDYNYLLHIKAATELFKTRSVDKEYIKQRLQYVGNLHPENIKRHLKTFENYADIKPSVALEAIIELSHSRLAHKKGAELSAPIVNQ